MIDYVRTRKWNRPGHVSIEYKITDGHRVSPPETFVSWIDLEGDWRDDGETK